MENQSLQANTQPLGYSIVFSPDKQQVAVPKCVTDYKSKPADSPGTLRKKLDNAAGRKKEEEQARLTRIQQADEAVTEFDKRMRPYIDALQQVSSEQPTASGASKQ